MKKAIRSFHLERRMAPHFLFPEGLVRLTIQSTREYDNPVSGSA